MGDGTPVSEHGRLLAMLEAAVGCTPARREESPTQRINDGELFTRCHRGGCTHHRGLDPETKTNCEKDLKYLMLNHRLTDVMSNVVREDGVSMLSRLTNICGMIVATSVLLAGCGKHPVNNTHNSVTKDTTASMTVSNTSVPKSNVVSNTSDTSGDFQTNSLQINGDSLYMTSRSVGWDFVPYPGNKVSKHSLLHTEDGGRSWLSRTPMIPIDEGEDVYAGGLAVNNNTAWFVTSSANNTTVSHTTDGGSSWISATISKVYRFASLSFVDSQHGWLLASPGPATAQEPIDLYYTSDGGLKWTQLLDKNMSDKLLIGQKTGLTFVNGTTGWITVDSGRHPGQVELYVTHDGGRTWTQQSVQVPVNAQKAYAHPEAPIFSSPHDGVLPVVYSGKGTVIFTTRDGGQTWAPSAIVPVSNLITMNTPDKQTICLSDGINIYISCDQGQHWGKWRKSIQSNAQIGSIYMSNQNSGTAYVVQSGGTSLSQVRFKSTDFS